MHLPFHVVTWLKVVVRREMMATFMSWYEEAPGLFDLSSRLTTLTVSVTNFQPGKTQAMLSGPAGY